MNQGPQRNENPNKNKHIQQRWAKPLRRVARDRRTLGLPDPGSATQESLGPTTEREREAQVQRACEELAYLLPRVAARFARKVPSHVELDDLVGAGSVGLVAAVRQHIDKPAVELKRLAEQRVRGAVLDYLRSIDHLTRRQRAAVSAVNRTHLRLTQAQGPSDSSAIARSMGVTTARVEHIRAHLCGVHLHSIDDAETLRAAEPDPAQLAAHTELKGRLVGALSELPHRLQTILSLYYCESLTYKEIGDIMGISRSRICQLHTQAIDELRRQLRDQAA